MVDGDGNSNNNIHLMAFCPESSTRAGLPMSDVEMRLPPPPNH